MATEPAKPTSRSGPRRVAAVVVASIVGTAVFGAVLYGTDWMESAAGLYGMDGVATAWLLLAGHSVVAVLGFVLLVTILSSARLPSVFGRDGGGAAILSGIVLGVVYGAALWAVVVAVGVPLWFEAVHGVERPFPYLHEVSLGGLVLFGAVVGASYSAFLPSAGSQAARVEAER